jgi:hypothetical protein
VRTGVKEALTRAVPQGLYRHRRINFPEILIDELKAIVQTIAQRSLRTLLHTIPALPIQLLLEPLEALFSLQTSGFPAHRHLMGRATLALDVLDMQPDLFRHVT